MINDLFIHCRCTLNNLFLFLFKLFLLHWLLLLNFLPKNKSKVIYLASSFFYSNSLISFIYFACSFSYSFFNFSSSFFNFSFNLSILGLVRDLPLLYADYWTKDVSAGVSDSETDSECSITLDFALLFYLRVFGIIIMINSNSIFKLLFR
jgi:hypothetical protein